MKNNKFIKKFIYPFITKKYLKSIIKSKKIFVKEESDVEIHSLVSKKDLFSYLICIKSFLRFYNNCSVVLHNDGTLTKKDENLIREHIINIKIYDKNYSDNVIYSNLSNYKRILSLRENNVLLRKLTDFLILSKSKKIINLDSDILFLKEPKEIIKWINDDLNEALLCNEYPVISYQDRYLPYTKYNHIKNLNSGLLCYYKDMIDLDLAEKFYSMSNFNDGQKIRFHGIGEQQFMAVNFANENIKKQRLNPEIYVNNRNLKNSNAIMKHYWYSKDSLLNLLIYLSDAKKVYKELKNDIAHT